MAADSYQVIVDWKEILAASLSEEEKAQGAAENAADAARKATLDKEKGRLGTLRISFEKAGRKGKPCTIVSEFQGSDEELVRLKKLLQQRLACGGSSCWNSEEPFDGQILLQGDCRQKAAELLRKEGYRTKGC
ncbi:MAG: translation initiation factor [Bacteroidales bacterium]|nr:translation initiation factor [Bacteroidales bacterium]